jgi:ERCC4-type nuclease
MILVAHERGSKELLPIIQRIGYEASIANLAYADFAFEGNGPQGPISIGIERKSLHDMLHCIDDARYAGYQRGGMKIMYQISFLAIEGMFRPHDNEGYLMEGFRGGKDWAACKYRTQIPQYSKLFNYLTSIALSGVIITFGRDMYHTAYNVCMIYDYFRKKWDNHTSLQEIQMLPLWEIGGRPSLLRRMLAQVDGIGVKLAAAAEVHFMNPTRQITQEKDWAAIKGISKQTAQRIATEIREALGGSQIV